MVNVLDMNTSIVSNATKELTGFSFDAMASNNEQVIKTRGNYKKGVDYTLIFNSDYAFRLQIGYDMTSTRWMYYDIKIGRNIIKRIVNTVPQKELDDRERQNNLKKAFHIPSDVVKLNKTIIVDDIYTTGSTIDAVARELRQHGVGKVYYLALCIGEGM